MSRTPQGEEAGSGERLQKRLARAGIASRRKAEELIRAGRVTVNGAPAELGMRVGDDDEVRVDGRPIARSGEHVTYMLNKPRGVLSAAVDDRGRRTVLDLVPSRPGLHPVGRLDLDSEGLILVTTDGELTLQLTHPRYRHRKTYRVWCREGGLSAEELAKLRSGVVLDDGPAKALVARRAEGGCVMVLEEGRNRQVRRMLAAVGYSVARLQRTSIGALELGDLPPGGWRLLGEEDLRKALARPPSRRQAGGPPR